MQLATRDGACCTRQQHTALHRTQLRTAHLPVQLRQRCVEQVVLQAAVVHELVHQRTALGAAADEQHDVRVVQPRENAHLGLELLGALLLLLLLGAAAAYCVA
jgi:hypothetical protein